MMIVASLTIDSGAAVFVFAMYSASDWGTSAVGNANADVTKAAVAMLKANQERMCLQSMSHLLQGSTGPAMVLPAYVDHKAAQGLSP
jgi:hypothetical protein